MRVTAWCMIALFASLLTIWNWDSLEPHVKAATRDDWTAFLILCAIGVRMIWMAIDRGLMEYSITGQPEPNHREMRRWMVVIFAFGAGLWICLR